MDEQLRHLLLLVLAASVVGAATAPLSRLVSRERGLFNAFGLLRQWVRSRKDRGRVWAELAEGITCPICVGVWLSTPLTLIAVAVAGLPIFSALVVGPMGLGIAYALLGLSALWQ